MKAEKEEERNNSAADVFCLDFPSSILTVSYTGVSRRYVLITYLVSPFCDNSCKTDEE